MENENTKKCKYCDTKIKGGELCVNCARLLPLVQELVEAGEPFRQLKAQRDRRRRREGR